MLVRVFKFCSIFSCYNPFIATAIVGGEMNMKKIDHKTLETYFEQRNKRAKELIDIFREENNDNNPNIISGIKLKAVRESNDEMLVKILMDLDLLE